MTKSISVLGKPTESIRVNGRGRERRGPSCLCEPTILPRRKPREGRTRDSEAEDEAVHGLSGHRCGPRADWRRQRRGSKDGRAMVRRGAEAWPRSQSQTQGRGDPRRASVCGAEIQGSRGFRLRETPHTKKLGRGDARPALSSSPASPCRTSSPPRPGRCQVSPAQRPGPRQRLLLARGSGLSQETDLKDPGRHATPRHAGRPGHSPRASHEQLQSLLGSAGQGGVSPCHHGDYTALWGVPCAVGGAAPALASPHYLPRPHSRQPKMSPDVSNVLRVGK